MSHQQELSGGEHLTLIPHIKIGDSFNFDLRKMAERLGFLLPVAPEALKEPAARCGRHNDFPLAKFKSMGALMTEHTSLSATKSSRHGERSVDLFSHHSEAKAGTDFGDTPAVRASELPFAKDALEPLISTEAMYYHYDKHFLGYVGKLNGLLAGTDYGRLSLEDIIRQAAWKRRRAILVNASQTWNHAFFWQSLAGGGGGEPDPILGEAIRKTFGSFAAFQTKFVERGIAHVGSGWLWLASHPERGLVISTTENTIPVWLASGRVPLLVCDLWEHSYYLDWHNDRAGWLKGFLSQGANWRFAGEQLGAVLAGRRSWIYGS